MPGAPSSRSLPGRPNLRHLKLEAKRRLAAGEFTTLHDAQVAMAREYGLPTWAALKERVGGTAEPSHALDQLRWIIDRFTGAGQQTWIPPSADELQQHFDERFLAVLPPPALVETIGNLAADLAGDLVVLGQTPVQAYVQLKGVHYIAVTEPAPPYRLTGLRALPVGSRMHDPRVADPPVRTHGEVPAGIREIAEQAFAELGLAAAGTVNLDRPANDYLTSITMADGTITVRELLSHTAGVDSPAENHADQVPELPAFLGPVIHASGPRGSIDPSNGGIAVLGQLLADVTGMPYARAATRTVLEPLTLSDSGFPARDHRTHVVLTTRLIPVNSIETRLLQAWTNPEEPR